MVVEKAWGKGIPFLPIICLLSLLVLTLLVTSSVSGGTGKWGEEVRLERQEQSFMKYANGRFPIQYNLTVSVVTPRDYVICVPEMTVQPVDWMNIVYSTTEWFPSDDEFICYANETKEMSITITPPFNQMNDTYRFVLRVSIEDNPDAYDEENMSIIIRQRSDYEVSLLHPPPGGEFNAIPPSTTIIRFALYNTGNGVDRFHIQASTEPADSGWPLHIASGVDENNITPELPPDMQKKNPHYIDVRVTMPRDVMAGVTVQIVLTVTSMFDTSLNESYIFASVTSLQAYGFEVQTTRISHWETFPDSEVEFRIRINNTGTGWDTFTIKPIWDPESNPGFIASAIPRTIDIDARSIGFVKYIVKVPERPPKGTYFFHAEILSSNPEVEPITKSFAVELGQFYAIELYSTEPNQRQTIPGGNLEFEVTVHNTGNGLDSIVIGDIIGAPQGWLTYTRPPEVTLLQDQEATVKVIVIVPSQFDEAPIGEYNLTVPASSARSDAYEEFYLEIVVAQFHRIEWFDSDVKPRRSFNPFEKDNITLTLQLKNYGNGRDTVYLEGTSPDPRVDVSFALPTVVLEVGETRPVKVTLQVERDIPPGVYNTFVNATAQGLDDFPRVLPIDFEIENYDALVPPIPMYIDPGWGIVRTVLRIDEGTNQSFKLKVENNGTRPLHGVLVRAFDIYWAEGEEIRWNFFNYSTPPIAVGDRFIVGERPFTADNQPIYWWANRTGKHTLEFRVYYPYQSNTDNDVSRLNITVMEAPTVQHDDDCLSIPALRWTIIGVLILLIITVTALGLNAWIKELKKPLRPW